MKNIKTTTAVFLTFFFAMRLYSQPYHMDTVVGGVQTLQVEGDVSVKQYGHGLGGNLKVEGDAHLAAGGIILPNMPSGVTGTYYGTQKVGPDINVGQYIFSKYGNNTTGDFTVPLGVIGDWWNSIIKLEIMTGPNDIDSGGAQFTILPRRQFNHGKVIAADHLAVGGGAGIKIRAMNNGMITLYMEYDADHPHGDGETGNRDHEVRVKISTIGTIDPAPTHTWFTLAQTTPIQIMRSMVSNGWVGENILGGKVTLSEPQGDISMGIYE